MEKPRRGEELRAGTASTVFSGSRPVPPRRLLPAARASGADLPVPEMAIRAAFGSEGLEGAFAWCGSLRWNVDVPDKSLARHADTYVK